MNAFFNIKNKKIKFSFFCYANFKKICKTHFLNISAFLKTVVEAFFSGMFGQKKIKYSQT